jgi:serine/threonine protein kinase
MGRPEPETRGLPAPTWSSNSLGKNTTHTVSNSLTEEDADWIVRRTELRVSQVIAKSQYVQHHCRLNDLPRFPYEELSVGNLIASGGFSNVHHIESFGANSTSSTLDASKKNYVVKHLNPKLANEPKKMAVGAKDLVMEAHFLASLDHPNIISLRGMCAAGVAGYAETGRAEGFFLIFDQLDRTLSQQLQKWRQMENQQQLVNSTKHSLFMNFRHKAQKNMTTFQDRIRCAHDIAKAVTYLHERNILYRDLKPGNCGFDADGVMQIFDFGLAVELPHSDDPNQLYNLAGNTGTARYMAPEVIKNKPYNFKADVFSFTTLLWEILALKKPFAELSGQDVKEWVADLGNRPHISKTWPQAIRKLMKAGWSVELEARPTMKEVRDILASLLE